MSELGEAIGTAAEGGLIGRAIAAEAGKPGNGPLALVDGHFAEAACLNCGTGLIGPHCHKCGQQAHLHRTLGAFLHDLLHGALHFDGKTWRTLPELALRPGKLTRRYIDGERARFVSPMALFLFSVFLMFAVFQIIGLTPPTDISTSDGIRAQIEDVRTDLTDERDALRRQVESAPAGSPTRSALQSELAAVEERIVAVAQTGEAMEGAGGIASVSHRKTGLSWLDKGLDKWRSNPGLMLYKLQANSYKFSWLLIPLSVPFVWLLFLWRRGFRAYDHAIFVTYSLAFMSLLFVALSLLNALGVTGGIVLLAGSLIPPVHIYKHLRGAYGLTRFSALWRLCVLVIFISVVVMLFLQILLLLGAF